jgi:hypothetical protein
MMSSETSTKPGQVFVLLSMAAATVAVMLTTNTHPAALLAMSGGVLACGLAAYFFHTALHALVGPKRIATAVTGHRRETLAAYKNRILHTIKEIEFDHRMGKINAKDFEALSAPLRRKAAMLIEELDHVDQGGAVEDPRANGALRESSAPREDGALQEQGALREDGALREQSALRTARPEVEGRDCEACGASNEADARFCKICGAKL